MAFLVLIPIVAVAQQDLGALEGQANQLYQEGKFKEAVVVLDKILKENPNDNSELLLKAGALIGEGNNQAALDLLNQMISNKAPYPEVYSQKAIALYNLGKYDEADQSYYLFANYIDSNSQTPNLGKSYYYVFKSIIADKKGDSEASQRAKDLYQAIAPNGFGVAFNYQKALMLDKPLYDYKQLIQFADSVPKSDPYYDKLQKMKEQAKNKLQEMGQQTNSITSKPSIPSFIEVFTKFIKSILNAFHIQS